MLSIIIRNYLRLLRAGCFAQEEEIEPMSAWKWGQVVELAKLHRTSALIYDGACLCQAQFFMQMPVRLMQVLKETAKQTETNRLTAIEQTIELIQQLTALPSRPILIGSMACSFLYDKPLHCSPSKVTFYFPYETQGHKADNWAEDYATNIDYPDKNSISYSWQGLNVLHTQKFINLSNKLLSISMQNILEQELRESHKYYVDANGQSIETYPPTLQLFHLIVQAARNLFNYGIMMVDLLDIGVLLRQIGDQVDFIKLQSWIEKMKMQRMSQLIGQLLIDLLSFSIDELPFMTVEQKSFDTSRIIQEILIPSYKQNKNMSLSQTGNNIFIHASNTSAMFWHARRSARLMKYYPSESITAIFSSFTHSLTDIEE